MAAKTCYDEFAHAKRERAKYPLPYGAYKLDEAQRTCHDIRSTISNIMRHERGRIPYRQGYAIGDCMQEERGLWLKNVPEKIAWLLGYKVLPGIKALEGENVSPAESRPFANIAEQDVHKILDHCEAARRALKPSVSREYREMRDGRSTLLPFVDETLDLIQRALGLVPQSVHSS